METFVLFPVRCYTCYNVLGNKQLQYEKLIEAGIKPGEAMDKLGLKRYCCRGNVLNAPRVNLGLERPPLGEIGKGMSEQEAEMQKIRDQVKQMTVQPPAELPTGGALLAMQNQQFATMTTTAVPALPPVQISVGEFEQQLQTITVPEIPLPGADAPQLTALQMMQQPQPTLPIQPAPLVQPPPPQLPPVQPVSLSTTPISGRVFQAR